MQRMVWNGFRRAFRQCCSARLRWCRTLKDSVLCRVTRNLLRRRLVRLLLFLLLLVLVAWVLHTRVLPGSMGYYHQECHLDESRRERMRHLLRHLVMFLNEENATYWLDFGTFLGVVREGDIMVHDGDMDLSRLADDLKADEQLVSRMAKKMNAVGMKMAALTARYQDVQVDLFRWRSTNASGRPLLKMYYPFVPAISFMQRVSDYLMPRDIPPEILFPLRKVSAWGVQANIPRRPIDFMKMRYPLTWTWTVPYKWKCWLKG